MGAPRGLPVCSSPLFGNPGITVGLSTGTGIHTSRGAVPIEDVRAGDEVMATHGYKPMTAWFDRGIQDIVEILTESGTLFRCTPSHGVAVLADAWGGHTSKKAGDLTPEDRLLFITRAIDGESQALLPLPDQRVSDHSGSTVHQPALDVETAWFLGKFFADGYVQVKPLNERGKLGNTQFSVSCGTKEVAQVERTVAWMTRHGLHVQHLHGKGNWITLRSSNRRIARWIAGYKRPNTPLRIPEPVWRSSIEVRAAFVAGLMDGDGCFTDRPVTVVATVYEEFGRAAVKLLATLGIIAEVRCRRPATPKGWKAQWIVTIKDSLALQRAEQLIGSHACKTWIGRIGKQAGYTVPGWMVKRDVPREQWASLWPSSRDPNMNSATLTQIVQATHYVPVAVRKVRPCGAAHTYELQIGDGNMFVAEGYLVCGQP
jgi:ribonucleotide reductase class II